jgi:hypothetical protein
MIKALATTKINYAKVGEAISHELAAKMIKNFHDAHPNEPIAYNIGRDIIDQILAQPNCVAMRIFKAIDETGKQTLVYAGLDTKGNTIIEYSGINSDGKLAKVEALVGDKTMGEVYNWFVYI